jgi:hypothetical protein
VVAVDRNEARPKEATDGIRLEVATTPLVD